LAEALPRAAGARALALRSRAIGTEAVVVNRIAALALSIAVAGTLAPALARADVYTWVDASGQVTASNLAPPSGVRVKSVVRLDPVAAARSDAAREAARAAEVAALSDRVRQLEREAPVPPPVPPAAPNVTVVVAPPLAPPPYAFAPPLPPAPALQTVDLEPPLNGYCRLDTLDCGTWSVPGFLPPGAIVVTLPSVHRAHGTHRPHRGASAPMRAGRALRRG
jgi:hypothetical protein